MDISQYNNLYNRRLRGVQSAYVRGAFGEDETGMVQSGYELHCC